MLKDSWLEFGKKLQKIFKKGIFLLVAAAGTIKAGVSGGMFREDRREI